MQKKSAEGMTEGCYLWEKILKSMAISSMCRRGVPEGLRVEGILEGMTAGSMCKRRVD